jgi:hypothetical protein
MVVGTVEAKRRQKEPELIPTDRERLGWRESLVPNAELAGLAPVVASVSISLKRETPISAPSSGT